MGISYRTDNPSKVLMDYKNLEYLTHFKRIQIIFGFLIFGNKHRAKKQLARIMRTIQKTFAFLIFIDSHRK